MTTALIFGGSGKVARHITRLLSAKGTTVYSIIRSDSQKSSIEALGGKPIVQSIEASSVSDLASTMRSTSPSVVIWSAGAGGSGGPERTKAVDQDGAIKAMDAAAEAGVKRFVMVSAIDIRDRSKAEPEWYDDADRKSSDGLWGAIGAYCEAKLAADRSLVGRRDLDWTIVRPGGLSEEAGTGKVSAGKVHISPKIPREDVARVIVEVIENEGTVGAVFDVVGGETDASEAVAGVAREKVNTFAGRY